MPLTRVLRWIGIVVLAALLIVDLVVVVQLVFLVVSSLTEDATDDRHGFAPIFGITALFVMVPIGLIVLALLRWLARPIRPIRRTRSR